MHTTTCNSMTSYFLEKPRTKYYTFIYILPVIYDGLFLIKKKSTSEKN